MNAAERSLRGRIAVHESWANTDDRAARTAPARQAFLDRFERQVDPDGILEPAERLRRAEHARAAYFARLALKSAQARRARKGAPELRAGSETGAETVAPEGSRVPTGAPAAAPQQQTAAAVAPNHPAAAVR